MDDRVERHAPAPYMVLVHREVRVELDRRPHELSVGRVVERAGHAARVDDDDAEVALRVPGQRPQPAPRAGDDDGVAGKSRGGVREQDLARCVEGGGNGDRAGEADRHVSRAGLGGVDLGHPLPGLADARQELVERVSTRCHVSSPTTTRGAASQGPDADARGCQTNDPPHAGDRGLWPCSLAESSRRPKGEP